MKKLKYLLFLFVIFIVPSVFAENLTSSEYAFGYYQGASEKTWSGYSSNNSSNYFGVTDPTKAEIVTFNSRFTLSNKFQHDYFYTISYTWYNNYDYNTNYTFYNALQDMGWFELGCYVTSSSSYATGSTCFTNSNVTITKKSNTTVNVSITFTPSQDIYRVLYQIDSEKSSSGVGFISYEYSITNVGMSVATSGTSEIINNNNQNTQEIINNNNQNTQFIVDALNENFQGCENYSNVYSKSRNPYNSNIGYLNTSGSIVSSSMFRYTDYLLITQDKTYFIDRNYYTIGIGYCLYDTNKTLISCSAYGGNAGVISFSPNQSGYIRLSYGVNSLDTLTFSGEYCGSKFNELNEDVLSGVNSIKDSIDKQIDSQKVCSNINKIIRYSNRDSYTTIGYLNTSTGNIINNNNFRTSEYIKVEKGSTLKVTRTQEQGNGTGYCIYDNEKNLISCQSYGTTLTTNITINESGYFRFSGSSDSSYQTMITELTGTICTNGNQAITDSITDSNVDSDTGTGFFDNFTSEDFGLSQIITIPLNTIQSLTSKTCVPLQVPIPFTNSNVTLPCMTEIYESKFPSIYNLWKIVSFGIIAYLISIDIFHIVKGFKDPESDKVEVLDL